MPLSSAGPGLTPMLGVDLGPLPYRRFCLAQTLSASSSALACLQAAPQPGGNPLNVQRGAITLVDAAVNPRNLCRLDPTWAPWY